MLCCIFSGCNQFELEEAEYQVNERFIAWSNAWTMDKYIHKSAEIKHFEYKTDFWEVSGTFSFTRIGTTQTSFFSAHIHPSKRGYETSNLCYIHEDERDCY